MDVTVKNTMEIRLLLNLFGTLIIYTGNTSAQYCKTHTNQFERDDDNVIVSFQAITTDENVLLTNRLLSPHNEQILEVTYRNGSFESAEALIGCHSLGNYIAGNLSCRIDTSRQNVYGTYKLAVNDVDNIYTCITVYMLGKPTRPAISTDKIYIVGETMSITCSSNSTTKPSNNDIKLVYTWKIDEVEPTHKRYNYPFNDRHVLAISDVQREDVQKLFKCYASENVSNSYTSYSSVSFSPHLFCSPRPSKKMSQNVTTLTHVPITLTFAVIADPPPGPSGFQWYKYNGGVWTRLLANENLTISSIEFVTYVTIWNVSKEDLGKYRISVSNVVGSYDHNMFLNEGLQHIHSRSTSSPELTCSNESAVVTGVVLGLLVAAISVYAVIITVLCIRKKAQGFKDFNILIRFPVSRAKSIKKHDETDPTQLASRSAQIQPASTSILSTEQQQQTVLPQGQQQQQTPVQYDDVEIVELRQVYTDLLHYEDSNNINVYDDLNPSV